MSICYPCAIVCTLIGTSAKRWMFHLAVGSKPYSVRPNEIDGNGCQTTAKRTLVSTCRALKWTFICTIIYQVCQFETIWPTSCWLEFPMHFLARQVLYFDVNFPVRDLWKLAWSYKQLRSQYPPDPWIYQVPPYSGFQSSRAALKSNE